jgi:xanthosine utilization system XapX-like protein
LDAFLSPSVVFRIFIVGLKIGMVLFPLIRTELALGHGALAWCTSSCVPHKPALYAICGNVRKREHAGQLKRQDGRQNTGE